MGRFGSEIYRTGRRDKRAKFRSMAVTAGQEYGLFIGGEVVEPASGEIRDLHEPATGEPQHAERRLRVGLEDDGAARRESR